MNSFIKAEISPECGLTKAVKRVFELKAVGMSSAAIAAKLYKSTKTIETQTNAYLQALGAGNTQEAIAIAAAEGWLTFRYVAKCLILAIAAQAFSPSTDICMRPPGRVRPATVRIASGRLVRREIA